VNPGAGARGGRGGALAAPRAGLGRLGERLGARGGVVGARPAVSAVPPPAQAEDLSEELVAVISAAIAAFLGKKPHIRQIRLLGTTAWAQQGRVTSRRRTRCRFNTSGVSL